MKNTLKAASILSWFNLIIWGYAFFNGLMLLTTGSVLVTVMIILFSSIPLNAYAALQLHKSIRNPEIKLSSATPTGLRFVGIVALLFACMLVFCGAVFLQNSEEMLRMTKEQYKDVKEVSERVNVRFIREVGVSLLVLGICIGVNIVLNIRLLRWYYLVRQSDVS
jgi:hypothetical protein